MNDEFALGWNMADGALASRAARNRARQHPERLERVFQYHGLPNSFSSENDVLEVAPNIGLTPFGNLCFCYSNGVKVLTEIGKTSIAVEKDGGEVSWYEIPCRYPHSWAAGAPRGELWRVNGRPGGGLLFLVDNEKDALAVAWLYRKIEGFYSPKAIFSLPRTGTLALAETWPPEFGRDGDSRPLVIAVGTNVDTEKNWSNVARLELVAKHYGLRPRTWAPPKAYDTLLDFARNERDAALEELHYSICGRHVEERCGSKEKGGSDQ